MRTGGPAVITLRQKLSGEPLVEVPGETLAGARLEHAVLLGVDLRGADLRGTHFRGADLCQADLRGADLSGANLVGADLTLATGGDHKVEIPADRINLGFVLGNKVMVGTVNANRQYFEAGVSDMALAQAEFPGWLEQLLTHPIEGLENYAQLLETLATVKGAIKVYCRVAEA